MTETWVAYTRRKTKECSELLKIAEDHADIVAGIFIIDTVVKDSNNKLTPILRMQIDINESKLAELKAKK